MSEEDSSTDVEFSDEEGSSCFSHLVVRQDHFEAIDEGSHSEEGASEDLDEIETDDESSDSITEEDDLGGVTIEDVDTDDEDEDVESMRSTVRRVLEDPDFVDEETMEWDDRLDLDPTEWPFENEQGPSINIEDRNSAKDLFLYFLTTTFLLVTVTNTNKYAKEWELSQREKHKKKGTSLS